MGAANVTRAIHPVVGVGAIVIGASGRSEVRDNIEREKISGTPDMTPDAVKAEVEKAGLKGLDLPSCTVADKEIDNGNRAKCFAEYIRIHTLEATDGKTYAEMPRFMPRRGGRSEARPVRGGQTRISK